MTLDKYEHTYMNWSDQVEDRRRETQKDKKSDIKQNDKRTPPPFDLF